MTDRAFWLAVRQALLMVVDAIERMCDLERTAEVRKRARAAIAGHDRRTD